MKAFLLLAALAAPLASWAAPASAEPHAAVLSDADHADVQRLETYLNGVRALKARFQQVAEDGTAVSGTAWLVRPGKMRFEYDPPSPLLLVAGHGLVVFRDNKLDQTTNIPMGQTPLGLLLRDKLELGGDVTVTEFRRVPGQLRVTVVKTASPGDGTLTLAVNTDPMALVGWSVVDAQGHETQVHLTQVQLGGDYPDKLFTFIDPHFFDNGGNTP